MHLKRLHVLDAWRGLAILGMVLYHLFFDLNLLGMLTIDFDAWWIVIAARIVQFSFLFLVGVSTYLVFRRSSSHEKFVQKQLKRFVVVGSNALLISFVTWVLFRGQFIGFGILHLIAFAIAVLSFLARLNKGSIFILSIAILVVSIFIDNPVDKSGLAWLGFYDSDFRSLDYFPVLPWLSVPMLGYVFGKPVVEFLSRYELAKPGLLSWAGRRSLLIYMVHQPILFFMIIIVSTLLA